jgi:hypothetical protein
MNQQLYGLLFSHVLGGSKQLTMGEVVALAKAAVTDPDIRRSWIFWGDSTMRLK